jgi:molybdopterin biosynthesis enzyme
MILRGHMIQTTNLGTLLLVGVHNVRVIPRVAVLLLGLSLVLLNRSFINDTLEVQQVARDGRFASI